MCLNDSASHVIYITQRRVVPVMELCIRSDQDTKKGQAEIALCAIIRTVIVC